MPDKVYVNLSRKEQEKIKPLVEDIIPDYLDGDMRKTALDFVAYLRADKLKPVWHSINTWKTSYKSEILNFIRLCVEGGEYGRPGGPPSWVVSPCLNHMHEYEAIIMNDGLQNIICDNMFYCVHDSKNGQLVNHCNPNKGCAGGVNRTILGKERKGLCSNRPQPWIWDPDEAVIDGIKKLLELEQKARDNNKIK